jgi:hypothetical protein
MLIVSSFVGGYWGLYPHKGHTSELKGICCLQPGQMNDWGLPRPLVRIRTEIAVAAAAGNVIHAYHWRAPVLESNEKMSVSPITKNRIVVKNRTFALACMSALVRAFFQSKSMRRRNRRPEQSPSPSRVVELQPGNGGLAQAAAGVKLRDVGGETEPPLARKCVPSPESPATDDGCLAIRKEMEPHASDSCCVSSLGRSCSRRSGLSVPASAIGWGTIPPLAARCATSTTTRRISSQSNPRSFRPGRCRCWKLRRSWFRMGSLLRS